MNDSLHIYLFYSLQISFQSFANLISIIDQEHECIRKIFCIFPILIMSENTANFSAIYDSISESASLLISSE